MENIAEGLKAAGEKVSQMAANASYENNKARAKNSDNSFGTRVGAAIDAAGDKGSEVKHGAECEAHKQRAIH
eukprot:TRINITY_DN20947_c0_g1_i1.p1 TRINITY_DN20947_c0_g1~~TRINITY_DN20947_c0_g1_i1.p1  ORF type:complete len:80 (-),score=15.75 TRINITY_DN20947_c0_g1_i1:68-283(-)